MLDCSPTNRERELGLDRREIGLFYPTDDRATIVILPSTRGTIDSHAWLKNQWHEATVCRIMTECL